MQETTTYLEVLSVRLYTYNIVSVHKQIDLEHFH